MLAQRRQIPSVVQFADALAGVAAVVAAVTLSAPGHTSAHSLGVAFSRSSAILSPLAAALFGWTWHACLSHMGLYDTMPRSISSLISRCFGAALQMSMAFAILYLASHGLHGLLHASLLFVLFSVLVELLRTILLTRIASSVFEQDETVIILGTGRRAQKAWRDLRVGNHSHISFAGFVNDCDPDELPPDIRQRFASRIENLPAFLQANHVDILIVATSLRESAALTRHAIAVAEAFDLRVLCLEDALELGRNSVPSDAGSVFNEVINHHRRSSSLLAIKNIADRMLALMLLTVSAPLLVCCCLAMLASGTTPIFVTRRKYGYHRHQFDMFSLNTRSRSRPSGPKAQTLPDSNANNDVLEADWPARVAHLLRTTYLDRLPRFLNVVRGDMALIGPEPLETPGSSPLENPEWELAFTAKPGLFRPSHLLDRSARCEVNAVKADFIYLASWSLWKDVSLLCRILFSRLMSLAVTIRGSNQGSPSVDRNQPIFGTVSGKVNE